jgi:hypothetical protein
MGAINGTGYINTSRAPGFSLRFCHELLTSFTLELVCCFYISTARHRGVLFFWMICPISVCTSCICLKQIIWILYKMSGTIKGKPGSILDLITFSVLELSALFTLTESWGIHVLWTYPSFFFFFFALFCIWIVPLLKHIFDFGTSHSSYTQNISKNKSNNIYLLLTCCFLQKKISIKGCKVILDGSARGYRQNFSCKRIKNHIRMPSFFQIKIRQDYKTIWIINKKVKDGQLMIMYNNGLLMRWWHLNHQ